MSGFAQAISYEKIKTKAKGNYYRGNLGEIEVILDDHDRVNVTKMCLLVGKRYSNWYSNLNSKQLLEEVASFLGLPMDVVVNKVKGGIDQTVTGTYVHPIIFTHILSWASPKFSLAAASWIEEWKKVDGNMARFWEQVGKIEAEPQGTPEKHVQDRIAEILDGKTEVPVKVGRIDVLTENLLIEVKNANNWMHGIGQLVTYGYYYPDHVKVLVLFDGEESSDVMDHCARMGIHVVWDSDLLCDELCRIEDNATSVSKRDKSITSLQEQIKELISMGKEHGIKMDKICKTNGQLERKHDVMSKKHDYVIEQNRILQEDVCEIGEELQEARDDIHRIDSKLGKAKNDRVVNTGRVGDKNCLIICKTNEEPLEDGTEYHEYVALRILKRSITSAMKRTRKQYPNATIWLKIDYTPNAIILWKKIKDNIGPDIEINGNSFSRMCDYSEEDLKSDILHVHNLRMGDLGLN